MKHKVFINDDDILEMEYVGDISEEENMTMIKLSYELITKLIDTGKKPLVLINMTQSNNFNPPAINTQAMHDSEAFKMAGYGINNQEDLKTAKAVVEKAGAENQVKIFDDRISALGWLKE